MKSLDHRPLDFVLYTGDSVGHHLLAQSFSKNMRTFSNFSNTLQEYFPRVYPSLGNHDTWPIDQYPEANLQNLLVQNYLRDWKGWFPSNVNWAREILKGGFYSILISQSPPVRLVSLNTLLEDKLNLIPHSQLRQFQRDWLIETLVDAEQAGELVWLIGHIYPSASEACRSYLQWYCENISDRFKDVIRYQFWGHTHSDVAQFYQSKDGRGGTGVAWMPGSLVPDNHQPTFRIFEYDPETMTILDYHQYSADLAWMTEHDQVSYKQVYSAKEAYGLDSMEYPEWYSFYTKMQSNRTLFENFYTAFQTGKPVVQPCSMGSACQKEFWASLRVC